MRVFGFSVVRFPDEGEALAKADEMERMIHAEVNRLITVRTALQATISSLAERVKEYETAEQRLQDAFKAFYNH